jgi:hypothetical protein
METVRREPPIKAAIVWPMRDHQDREEAPRTHADRCRSRARLPVGSKKIGLPSMGERTFRIAIHSSTPVARIYAREALAFQCQNAASLVDISI